MEAEAQAGDYLTSLDRLFDFDAMEESDAEPLDAAAHDAQWATEQAA